MNKEMAFRWIWKADRDFLLATQVNETFPDMAALRAQRSPRHCERSDPLVIASAAIPSSLRAQRGNPGTQCMDRHGLQPRDDEVSVIATLFRYPNEEEVDFPDSADLQSARKFCEAAKQMVLERISVALDIDRKRDGRSETPEGG